MPKLEFDNLSLELKAEIIERVVRASDLKRVCLVNKQLHELAVKPLYRCVELDIGSPDDHRLSAFLSPSNKGLPHCRKVFLYLASGAHIHDCNQDQQAQLVAKMIIEFLPPDILEEFSWCPWKPFSTDVLLLLYRKQRKMQNLEVMDLDRDVLPTLKKNSKMCTELFSNARSLAMYPENKESLDKCGFFVNRVGDKLQDLTIKANFPSHDSRDTGRHNSVVSRDLNDTATAPGLLTRTIFEMKSPFESCEPFPNLTVLRLDKINLRYPADTWCKVINFTKIECLRIVNCAGADSFLGNLCKAFNLPKKLQVFEIQHNDNTENEALVALDGFLCLVSGVRDLIIDLRNVKCMPATPGIVRHSKTLELLSAHCSLDPSSVAGARGSSHDESHAELVWKAEDFEKICTACTALEELSCAWPQTSLIRAMDEEWQAFERACENLKEMVTLHISTFPNNKPSTQLLPRAVYDHLIQGLAQRVFELAQPRLSEAADSSSTDDDAPLNLDVPVERSPKRSKLRLIAFGISDKIYEREDSDNLSIFLRSTCQDAEGRTQVHATPIGWNLRRFVESRSGVLDIVLPRRSRPPCRESSSAWHDDDD